MLGKRKVSFAVHVGLFIFAQNNIERVYYCSRFKHDVFTKIGVAIYLILGFLVKWVGRSKISKKQSNTNF